MFVVRFPISLNQSRFYYYYFLCPPAQSGRRENWKLSKIMTTACYSVSTVLRKAISFPLWSAIDSRWNRNTVSLVSPVTAAMHLPSSCMSSTASAGCNQSMVCFSQSRAIITHDTTVSTKISHSHVKVVYMFVNQKMLSISNTQQIYHHLLLATSVTN